MSNVVELTIKELSNRGIYARLQLPGAGKTKVNFYSFIYYTFIVIKLNLKGSL